MPKESREITLEKLVKLEKKKIKLQDEMRELDAWLRINKLSEKRNAYVRRRLTVESELRQIKSDLNFLWHKKEHSEAVEINNQRIEAIRASKQEKDLIFQCSVIFNNLKTRGIGFDVKEKAVIQKLNDYVLQM